ncbi:MAG: hypothetical protein MJZ58_06555, partial [Paludibacteraceae bacterium]|nr:hypothetical protein [Paludibacteraceae bacterium]
TGVLPLRKFQCVYSAESTPSSSGGGLVGATGSLAPVVGTFGFTLASLVINQTINLLNSKLNNYSTL